MKIFKLLVLLLLINCFGVSLPAYSLTLNKMVVFGNSLSDTGNLYDLTLHFIPQSPPYYKGRMSNGPIWVDDLVTKYHLDPDHFHDYAVAGATAKLHLNFESLPYTIEMEMYNYLVRSMFCDRSKTLYVIWVGEGDYLHYHANVVETAHDAVDNIMDSINLLIAHNGKYILILNLPDEGTTPKAIKEGISQNATALTNEHNKYLQQQIAELQQKHPDVKLMLFDANKEFADGLKNPEKYGIHNVTDACYTGGYRTQELLAKLHADPTFQSLSQSQQETILNSPSLLEAVFVAEVYKLRQSAGLSGYPDCTGYVFWDNVHPTKEIHQILADKVYDFLNHNGFVLQTK